ncbi:MAG TPA: DUF6544 family protein [Burkholderiaceae bacterium]|nr:DUF6544 family protein [Burkholderiaceae bacterium]
MALVLWAMAALVALAVLAAALGRIGTTHWHARTRALHLRLAAAQVAVEPARYDAARELAGLPEPVQRYFRAVLQDGQPMIAALTVEHTGRFNLAPEGAHQWRPFTSRQRSTMQRPGFVWDARIAILPGLAVHVHDAYVAGEGLLRPAVMGLLPLADLRGSSPEPGGLAHGECLRWFAEAAWYPTALLPSQGVHWSALDDSTARATLSDGALQCALLLRFDAHTHLVASVRAEARGAIVGNKVVTMPWEGRWSDYRPHDGMLVPTQGEVAWITPQGPRPYWRGSVVGLAFEYAG